MSKAANRGRVISEAEFRRMWFDRENWPLSRMAEYLRITDRAVQSRAKSRKLPPRNGITKPSIRRITASQEAEFRAMYEFGVGVLQIAAHFGIAHGTVTNTARRLGYQPRTKGGKTPPRAGRTCEEYLRHKNENALIEHMTRDAALSKVRIRDMRRGKLAARQSQHPPSRSFRRSSQSACPILTFWAWRTCRDLSGRARPPM